MAKHPLDVGDKKLSKEGLAEALRLAIIAELDAINLYLQLARAVEDEAFRKVFEDVAKEEKTHVGEFLALLKNIDPEQVEELKHGAEEAAELAGVEAADPPAPQGEQTPEIFSPEEWKRFLESFTRAADSARILRRHLSLYRPGRGVEAVVVERISEENGLIASGDRLLVPMREISVKFSVAQRMIDHARRRGENPDSAAARLAASKLGYEEDRVVLEAIMGCRDAGRMRISSWDEGGAAVREVSQAMSSMVSAGIPGPYLLLVGPERYSKLVAVHERTGVMELTRLKQLVGDVAVSPLLPPDKALLLSTNPAVIDLAIGADTVVDYLGPEDGQHVFRAWETLALRVKHPKAILVMEQTRE